MSWSWSHTPEAYENARENLSRLSIQTLAIIMAEWDAHEPNEHFSSSSSQLNLEKYKERLKYHRAQIRCGLPKDAFVNSIWDKAEELATCTNGGWKAWMCPFGCGCHMVSFSTFSERMAEARQRKADNRRLARIISGH
jgi:hypothetical protein